MRRSVVVLGLLAYMALCVALVHDAYGADNAYLELSARNATGDSNVSWLVGFGATSRVLGLNARTEIEAERERYGERYLNRMFELQKSWWIMDTGWRLDDDQEADFYASEWWWRLRKRIGGLSMSAGWKGAASDGLVGDMGHFFSVGAFSDVGPLRLEFEYDRGATWILRTRGVMTHNVSGGWSIGPRVTAQRYPDGSKWHTALLIVWRNDARLD